MRFDQLGLQARIAIGFGTLLAIAAAIGITSYRAAVTNQDIAHQVLANAAKKDLTVELQIGFELQRIGMRDILMERDTSVYDQGRAQFQHALDELRTKVATQNSKDMLAAIEQSYASYGARYNEVIVLYRKGDHAAALEMFKSHDALIASTDLKQKLDVLTAWYEQHKNEAVQEQLTMNAAARTQSLVLMLAGLVFGVAVALIIARSILRAIQRMSAVIQTIAARDLTQDDMQVLTSDELGNAAKGLNQMKNSLRDVIFSIASTAENVSGSSRQIAATAVQVAESTDGQRRQVQQAACAMAEMAATIRLISSNANDAAQTANSAVMNARSGGTIVAEILKRLQNIVDSAHGSERNMQQLSERSEQIGRIVSVIDEIAKKTNLLALNAAIEAARAGAQGRGFAVVAGEVRHLAERTTEATREIAAVIESVQSATSGAVTQMKARTVAVEEGVAIATTATDAIAKMLREVEDVGRMIAEIAEAAMEQSITTQQVNESMSKISVLAAESAAGTKDSAMSCEQLFNLSVGLQNMVARFRLAQPQHTMASLGGFS